MLEFVCKGMHVLENMSQKLIVKLLMVKQPSIVIDLLINKIYWHFHHKLSSSNELHCYDEVLRTI